MEQIITEFISRFGYAAIFILILLEKCTTYRTIGNYSDICWSYVC